MNKSTAFTLVELLIAMAISSFIMLGVIQSYRNSQKTLLKSRTILATNKAACLFFNQIERDFNTAFIPAPAKLEKKDPKNQTPEPEEKKEMLYFVGEGAGDDTIKKIKSEVVDGEQKKYERFKKVSFINTNPFQVWGPSKVRLVRVSYELEQVKQKMPSGIVTYNLYRKETASIKNMDLKPPDELDVRKNPDLAVKKMLVASNIKEMYLEYSMPQPKNEKNPTADDEKKIFQSFAWGKTKETKNIVPQQVELRITFWNSDFTDEMTYVCVIPIVCYPTKLDQKTTTT